MNDLQVIALLPCLRADYSLALFFGRRMTLALFKARANWQREDRFQAWSNLYQEHEVAGEN